MGFNESKRLNEYNSETNFNFLFVEKVDVLKEIKMLQSNKALQNTNTLLN